MVGEREQRLVRRPAGRQQQPVGRLAQLSVGKRPIGGGAGGVRGVLGRVLELGPVADQDVPDVAQSVDAGRVLLLELFAEIGAGRGDLVIREVDPESLLL